MILASKRGVKPILFLQRTQKSWLYCPAHGAPGLPSQGSKPDPRACVTKGKDNKTLPVSPERDTLCPVSSVHRISRRWLGRSLEWEGKKKKQICILNQFCFRLGIKLWCLCGFQLRFLSMGTKIKVELKPFSFIHTCGVLKFWFSAIPKHSNYILFFF